MAITKDKLAQIIANSSETIRAMENRPQGGVSRGRINESSAYAGGPSVDDYDKDADYWDRMYLSDGIDEEPSAPARDISYSTSAIEHSSMPDNIKKSLMEKRIDVSALNPNGSVVDQLKIKGKLLTGGNNRQVVTEQSYQRPQYSAGSNIDYSIIKAIVSECIRDYFNNNNVLNENALKSIVLKNGTIGLVDNAGNVYKAKLEKVKKKEE